MTKAQSDARKPTKPKTQAGTPKAPPAKQAAPKPAKPKRTPRMPAASVRPFMLALSQANPVPKTELHYQNTFTLLVAVVLSAQSTDVGVNKVTPALFAAAPTPAAMAALGATGIGKIIRTLGLWQGKAKNVAELARQLVEHHDSEVPRSREALEALPGVGRKTANVVLNVAFGEPTLAVDTHIFRIGNRTGLGPGTTPRAVEDALLKRIPTDLLPDAHHLLILHGRYVCKARTPECWRCVAALWCKFPSKTKAKQ